MDTTLEQPKTGLGSVDETNRLLQESSKQTGISAPTFSPSGAITSEALSSNESQVKIPETNPSTLAAGITGATQSYLDQGKFQREQEQKAQEAQAGLSQDKSTLQGFMEKYLGVQSSRAGLEESAGIQKLSDTADENRISLEQSQRAQTNELKALEGQGLTDVQKAQSARAINHKYALEQVDLQFATDIAERRLDRAQRTVDRKIELQLEPLRTQMEFTKFFYEENKENFTKAEDRAFATKVTQLNQQYETEKANKTAIANIQLEALKNGVQIPSLVLKELNSAKDAQEATAILAKNGISLQSATDRLQQEKLRLEISNLGGAGGLNVTARDANGNPVVTPESQALSVILGSGKFTKEQVKQITNSVNNGEEPFTVIKNQAKQLLTGANQTKLENAEAIQSSMMALKDSLNAYYAAGGNTGLIRGSFEKVANNLGQVQDPGLATLAVEVQSQLQSYRNAISGTAYSDQEGKDIASVFPGINKSKNLNDAIFVGRDKSLQSTIDGSYKSVLGSSYDSLKKVKTEANPVTPVEVNAAYDSYLKAVGK